MINLAFRFALACTFMTAWGSAWALGCNSTGSGNWNSAARWSCGRVPLAVDNVFILATHTVTIDTAAVARNVTVNAGGTLQLATAAQSLTVSRNMTLSGGSLQISAGTMNIGNVRTSILALDAGATFQMTGGALNVAGGINDISGGSALTFTMTGGTITVQTIDAGPLESFMLDTGSTFNMSGGTIVLQNGTAITAGDDVNIQGAQNVTGGTLQIGNASTPGGGEPFLIMNGTGGPLDVWNLVVSTTGSPMALIGSPINIRNDLTIQAGATLQDNDGGGGVFPITVGGGNAGGNWINNGTFTPTAGDPNAIVTFAGSANVQIGGAAATAFENLTINKSAAANTVTIACGTPSPTVNATLTLTMGKIVTSGAACATGCSAQVPIIVDVAGTITGGSATSYVQGALRKNFSAGSTLNFRPPGQDEFPVGDAANYTPVEITAGGTSTAGNVVVCVTPTDHPQVKIPPNPTGRIDEAKSVNRYWSFTNTGLNTASGAGAALLDATFKFVAGDVDPGAITANFIVDRWNGVIWNPTTLVTPAATSTRALGINLTGGTNDFAIGDPILGVTIALGNFNAFDNTAPPGAAFAYIQTKQAGVAFTLRVVRIANNSLDTTYNQAGVTVELYDSSNNTGVMNAATGCRASWVAIPGTAQSVTLASGVTTASFTVANVFKDVRVHIVKLGAGAGEGCSGDRFAIRPQSLTISALDATWQTAGTARTLNNTGASGGNVHAASTPAAATPRPFTLRATPVPASATNYDGSPTTVAAFPACIAPPVACTTGALSYTAGSWTAAGSGVRENATAHYSEAGVFNLQLEDQTYAAVDAVDGSSLATLTVPATATVSVGRFVPDRFAFSSPNTPQLQTFGSACASRTFTYIGQSFWYATLPSATVQALNAAGTVTTNYSGTLFKLTGGSFSETYSGNAVGPVLVAANIPPAQPAQLTGIGSGSATYTSRAGSASPAPSLVYTRSTASPIPAVNNPFTANISFTVTATDSSENGAVGNPGNGGTPALTSAAFTFNGGGGGIAFDSGALFRYGLVRLANTYGMPTIDLPITLEARYWTGAAFAPNPDNCTTFIANNFKLSTYQGGITSANVPQGNISISGTLSSGSGNLKLLKPTGQPPVPSPGSVQICLALVNDARCTATTPAGQAYLQGPWTGSTYDQNPSATAGFGQYGSQPKSFIYFRENY